jgi:rRNA maturation RNase YbeY
MNQVAVFAVDRKFRKLEKVFKKTAEQLMRLSGLKNDYLEIYLVGERLLNKNVLAFPAPRRFPRPDVRQKPLGEIYLNPDYIRKRGENPIYMLIHGFLHILGYDHNRESGRIRMENMEQKLFKTLSQKI